MEIRSQAHKQDQESVPDNPRQALELLELAERCARAGTRSWDISTNRMFWSMGFYRLFRLDPETTAASIVQRDGC